MGALPDVSRLEALAERLRALGDRLRAAGYSRAYARPILGIGRRYVAPLAAPLHLWHLRSRAEPSATVMRMLGIGDPVTEGEARAVLGAELVAPLVDAGFLVTSPAGITSPFAVTCVGDAYVVHDRWSVAEDAVVAPRAADEALCNGARPAEKVGRVLQLRCGSAGWALSLAPYAERVVGVDPNPRAIALGRVGAALTGARNVELREGDTLEKGEAFDVVVAAPPCVAAPKDAPPRSHLHGGERGDELALSLVGVAFGGLSAAGRAIVVADFPVIEADRPLAARVRKSIDDGNARAVVLTTARGDVDELCGRVAMAEHPALGAPLASALMALRTHYAKMKISAVHRAVVAVERARKGTKYVATQAIHAPPADTPLTRGRLDELFSANDLIAGGKITLLPAKLRISPGAAFAQESEKAIAVRFHDDTLLEPTTVSPRLYAVAAAVARAPTVREGLLAFAKGNELRPPAAIDKLVPDVERALRLGILEVADSS